MKEKIGSFDAEREESVDRLRREKEIERNDIGKD